MIGSFSELERALTKGDMDEVVALSEPHPLEIVLKGIGANALYRWQEYGEGNSNYHFKIPGVPLTLDVLISIKKTDKAVD